MAFDTGAVTVADRQKPADLGASYLSTDACRGGSNPEMCDPG